MTKQPSRRPSWKVGLRSNVLFAMTPTFLRPTALLGLLLVACSGGPPPEPPKPPTPGDPTLLGELKVVGDDHLTFGPVFEGDEVAGSVTVQNVGEGPLDLVAVELESGDASHFLVDFAPATLDADDTQTIGVRFLAPAASAAPYEAVLGLRASGSVDDEGVLVSLEGTVTATSAFSWSPTQIDCGHVPVGVEYVETLTFQNASAREVVVSAPTTANPSEFYVVDPAGVTVPAGGEATIQIACRPAAEGPRQTALTFETDIGGLPNGNVGVKMIGGSECLHLSASTLDFGETAVGCTSVTREVTLTNTCSAPFTLAAIAVDEAAGQPAGGPDCPGSKSCPEFHVVGSPSIPAAGLEVAPGEEVALSIKYKPIDLGADVGRFTVTGRFKGADLSWSIALHSGGVLVYLYTDIFTIEEERDAGGFGFPKWDHLTGVPDLSAGPITVLVNGSVVPPTDQYGHTVWWYDPVRNKIIFEPLYEPEVGSKVEVRYYTTCFA